MTHTPALFSTIAALFALPFFAAADDWPQYNGANSDRKTKETIAVTNWSGSGPRELWRVPENTGFSSYTIAGGKAYTLSKRELDGIDQEICLARDAATGKELWATPLSIFRLDNKGGDSGAPDNKGGDGPRSTPAFSDDHVYTFSSELALHCLDAKTGDVVWSENILKKYDGRNIKWENASSPLIAGDFVLVYGGGKGDSMICFDKKTGKKAWSGHDYLMTHATPVSAVIHGVPQIIFFTQKGLVSCDFKTGRELWMAEFPYKVSTAASPVVYEDIVYCAAGYGVGSAAFKITKSGTRMKAEEMWRIEGNHPVANHWSTPLVKDGYLYGMFSFKEYGDGPVKCVDIKTGDVKWEKEGFGPGNIILTGSGLVALSDTGELVLIEATPDKYNEISRFKAIGGKCWSSPTYANGRLYCRSTNEGACFDVGGKTAGR